MNKTACIIPLSGGLDSTYLLYKIIKERPNTDIYVPHVSIIKDDEPYHAHELIAVQKIIEWFREEFPNRIVCFRNPTIDLTGYPTGLDTDGVLVMAQKLLYFMLMHHEYTDIKLYIGLVADDGMYAVFRNRFKNQGMNNRIWCTLHDSMIGRCDELRWRRVNRNIQYPLYHQNITKADIIGLIPPELLSKIWVCRRPKDDKPCGDCESCKTHNNAIVRGTENGTKSI